LALSAADRAREDVKTLFAFGELDDYVSFGRKGAATALTSRLRKFHIFKNNENKNKGKNI
jgi:hypothetical protein